MAVTLAKHKKHTRAARVAESRGILALAWRGIVEAGIRKKLKVDVAGRQAGSEGEVQRSRMMLLYKKKEAAIQVQIVLASGRY